MITRRNFLGTAAIIGAAGTAILHGEESKPVANAAAAGAPESTAANSASSGATGSTVGTYLATRLEQVGVRDYFVVPGDFNLILLDQILENPRLRMIGCCNELNAGYAADGYARSNGVAAMVVTYSVGGLSALNAVRGAYSEDSPVIVIVGGSTATRSGRTNSSTTPWARCDTTISGRSMHRSRPEPSRCGTRPTPRR